MVVANFERALVGFAAGRILTEGVIFVNAILAMILVLTLPRENEASFERPTRAFGPLLWKTAAIGVVCAILAVFAETGVVRGCTGIGPRGTRAFRRVLARRPRGERTRSEGGQHR
jgi:hypothetical protein